MPSCARTKTADAQAGVGTRDVEEARAVRVTDANVLHRCCLARRKIGGLHTRDRYETGCGTKEKALHELHRNTPKQMPRDRQSDIRTTHRTAFLRLLPFGYEAMRMCCPQRPGVAKSAVGFAHDG